MNTVEFNKKVKCNGKFLAVRIIDNIEDLKIGNIYVTSNLGANGRLAHGIIEDVGDIAQAEYGLEVGQYVLFDRLSTFGHTSPIALLEYNNVICLTNADQTEYHPLKGMMFVEPDEKAAVTNVGGIFVSNYTDKLNIGTIVDTNFTEKMKDNFKINDKVMLVKGGDVVKVGERTLFIYKEDMLICTIND